MSGRSVRGRFFTVYTVSPRHWFIGVRLAILEACRQVCSASFTFLGLLMGRWQTLCCSGTFSAHVRLAAATPFEGPLAKLVNLCTYGRQIASAVRRAGKYFEISLVSAYKSISRFEVGSLELRGCQGAHFETDFSRSTRCHRDIGSLE